MALPWATSPSNPFSATNPTEQAFAASPKGQFMSTFAPLQTDYLKSTGATMDPGGSGGYKDNTSAFLATPEGKQWQQQYGIGINQGFIPTSTDNFVDKVGAYAAPAGMAVLSGGALGFLGAGAGAGAGEAAAGSDLGMLGATSAGASGGAGAIGSTAPSWSTLGPVGFDAAGAPIADTGVTSGTGAIGTGVGGDVGGGSGSGGGAGGMAFSDTATGVSGGAVNFGNSGSGGVLGASSSSSLPASAIGTSSQLPAGMGPIGDVASGVGDTNTALDYSLGSTTSPGLNATGAATNPMTGASPSTFSSILSGAGSFAAKYGLPLAALSTQLLRRPGIPQEGNLSNQYNTQEAQGQASIAQAQANQISPSQQAQIDKFTTDSTSALKQYFANSGQGVDSTSYLESQQKVGEAAIAMQQGFVDQLFSQGMQELGLADSAQSQLIQLRMQREQQTSDALNNFMLSLGLMGAFSK